MYDINFFRKIKQLKTRIVSKKLSKGDVNMIFKEFENMRRKEPFVFNIETTNYCNMKCIMCPRTTSMTRKNTVIDDEKFLEVLDQIEPHPGTDLRTFWRFIKNEYDISPDERSENSFYFYISSRCLTLHGYGEPLLDKKIVERVQACTDRNMPTYFSCVPANVSVEKAEALMKAGLGALKFSIDATNDELQKKIRGEKNEFSKSFDVIKKILDLKKKMEYKTLIVTTMISLADSDETRTTQKEFLELWKQHDTFTYVKSQDNKWYFEEDGEMKNLSHYEQQYCEFPWLSLTVMADGSVVPCTQDYNTEMVFGNTHKQTLEQIWNSDKYRQFRKWHINGDFPTGYKCRERCDLKELNSYLNAS